MTYTIKSMAAVLADDPGERAKFMRQLRHWTAADLLRPIGQKHTGRGVSRLYAVHELRKAALIKELVNYGVTVPRLEGFGDWIDTIQENKDWLVAVEKLADVFLALAWNFHAEGQPALFDMFFDSPKWAFTMLKSTPKPASYEPAKEIDGVVILNMTKIFKRLSV